MGITNKFYDSHLVPDCIVFMRKFIKLFLEYGYKVGRAADAKLDIEKVITANEMLEKVDDPAVSDEEITKMYKYVVREVIRGNSQEQALLIPLMISAKEAV